MSGLRRGAAAFLVAAVGCVTTAPARNVDELVTLEGDAIIVRETIRFEHGKVDVDPRSHDLLDAVAAILARTPSIAVLTIEGHTDDTGEPAANPPMSEARAQAVKRYLESKGIAPERLEVKGYGAEKPIGSNETEEGRARNRRVEFKISR